MDQDRQTAKENFRDLPARDKIAHIIRYHGWKFVAGIVLIVMAVSIIGRFTFAKEKEACLGIAVHAKYMDPDQIDLLSGLFSSMSPDMLESGKKEFKIYSFYNGYTAAEAEEKTATIYRMAAFIQTQMLDIYIGDEESLRFDGSCGYLIDLREVFTEKELELIREKADLLSKDGESGILSVDITKTGDTGRITDIQKDIPVMISIRGVDSIIDESVGQRPAYIGIVSNAPNLDNARRFILQLLHIEP